MKNNGSFLLILFLILPILVISISQFVYAQTVENEIIENTLEIEKATGKNALEIDKMIPSNLKITESAANNTTPQEFQIEDIVTDMGNATEGTESALTNVTADAREKIEEARSDKVSAITETPETAPPAQPAGTQNERVLTLFEADEFNKMKKTVPPAQPAGTQNERVLTLFEADEFNKMKKTVPPAQPETAQETAPPAQPETAQETVPPAQPEGTERPSEEPTENGGNFLDQIIGGITNLFK
jgi:hypothetical protein